MTTTVTQPTFASNAEYVAARQAYEDAFVAAETTQTALPRGERKKLALSLNKAEAEFFDVCKRLEAQPQYHQPLLLATAGMEI